MLLLTEGDVMKVLDMPSCMEVTEKAFAELSLGTAILPLRINIVTPDGSALYMPACLQGMCALGCKVVTSYVNNPTQHHLPTIMGKVLLQDPRTGDVTCIMDGKYLTAVRTGAASGVATKYLARYDRSQKVGIFGAGVQGSTQLWAMSVARNLSKAYVYDINDEAIMNFTKAMSTTLKLEIVKADSPDLILKEADIICTATTSSTPIFDGNRVREGTHINSVGSHVPKTRELDSTIIRRAKIIVDSYEACLNECGDIMTPIAEGVIDKSSLYAELGEIIIGKKRARAGDKEITVFKSNGLAIQDVATAKLVYDKAVQAGIGTEVGF